MSWGELLGWCFVPAECLLYCEMGTNGILACDDVGAAGEPHVDCDFGPILLNGIEVEIDGHGADYDIKIVVDKWAWTCDIDVGNGCIKLFLQ